jgi:nitrile hydratase
MGEEPVFKAGDAVKIAVRFPVGHYRVPRYIRGKRGTVEAVITPAAVPVWDDRGPDHLAGRRHLDDI